jgi:NAD(P)-dependent dehydrogenase (short-subunit alcohol dehydrogenase family)
MNDGNTRIRDKAVVVTGGASGIGRATCQRLAASGARVCVADFNEATLRASLSELQNKHGADRVMGHRVDVREESDVQSLMQFALDKLGRIDALVHSAGILRGKDGTPRMLHDTSVQEFDDVVRTNLRGTFLCNREVLPVLMKQRGGDIVNISSTSGIQGRAFDSAYCASKFGVVGLTESVREEVRGFGIRVHAVLPDAVDTPLWEQNGPIRAPDFSLAPERVAEVIEYILALPPDVILGSVVIAPMRSKRRRAGKSSATSEAGAAGGGPH